MIKRLNHARDFVFLGLITWITHFYHFKSFGLYEDDYHRTTRAMAMGWLQFVKYLIEQTREEGRPLHDGLIIFFSFLGNKIGGLSAIYIFGYLIVLLNVLLLYLLLKRLSKHPFIPLAGALGLCLFPADTTRTIYLTHSLGVQPSITFLLMAFHFYIRGKTKSSYLAIIGSLFTYETAFPVFLAAPLLTQKTFDLSLLWKMVRHACILFALAVLVALIRVLGLESGRGRIQELDDDRVWQALINTVVGPITSLKAFWQRAWEMVPGLGQDKEMAVILFLCLTITSYILHRRRLNLSVIGSDDPLRADFLQANVSKRNFLHLILAFAKDLRPLIVSGVVMLLFAYPLTLTTTATALGTKSSRVHAAASIGAAILFACVLAFVELLGELFKKRVVVNVLMASFLSLLVGFGLVVQKDFQASWSDQKNFWADVVRLAPDIEPGTVVLIDGATPYDSQTHPFSVSPYFASISLVPKAIYDLSSWEEELQVFILQPDWRDGIISDSLFVLNDMTAIGDNGGAWLKETPIIVEPGNVILLEKGEETKRLTEVTAGDKKFQLKQLANVQPGESFLKEGAIYQYLAQR